VLHIGLVSTEKLLQNLKDGDVCLGIFGNSIKSFKVLTNKGYQILASQKPLITMDSPASTECNLKDKVNCLLVPTSNPKELANAIMFLKNNESVSEKIAMSGYQTYMQHLSLKTTGRMLKGILKELTENRN